MPLKFAAENARGSNKGNAIIRVLGFFYFCMQCNV